ncbi:protein-export chaperone SecB [Sphingomonas daechungensis]|uniref:protein-export chaperone SecB n=1 Tax=Sphingomonas daechungensis TaxID=1176646 RepID=UPI00378485F7
MADQDTLTPGNGSGDQNLGPQAATLAQYIKDLSIENPNAPHVFQWQDQPRVDVQFNINVDRVSDDVHEVVIKLDVSARSDSGVQFMIELSYGGLFGLRNFPEEALGPFLLVEAPRLLFPFARQIIAESTQNAGFPPLLLDGIDFGAAYLAQLQAAQEGEPNGSGEAAPAESAPSPDEGQA